MSTVHRSRRVDPGKWRCPRALGHVFRPGEGSCIACGVRLHPDDPRTWRYDPPGEPDGLATPHINDLTLEPEDWPYEDR